LVKADPFVAIKGVGSFDDLGGCKASKAKEAYGEEMMYLHKCSFILWQKGLASFILRCKISESNVVYATAVLSPPYPDVWKKKPVVAVSLNRVKCTLCKCLKLFEVV
jgi:hypothetical protein